MRRLALALALALVPASRSALAQDLSCDAGGLEIRRVSFAGNAHFEDRELSDAIVTTPSSWLRRVLHLPIGARHCVDTLEVQRDAIRLRLFYRQRGYYDTRVAPGIESTGPRRVAVAFRITEGPPVRIGSLAVTGLDSIRPRLREAVLRQLEAYRGAVYDKVQFQATIDSVVTRMLNNGYAHAAQPLRDISVDNATHRADVKLAFLPGPSATIGRIEIVAQPNDAGHPLSIDTSTVRNLLSFHTGEMYRQRDLLRSQRDLYGLETYRHVDVGLLPDSEQTNDTSLAVRVFVAEANMKSMRVGVGWATLDCARTEARFTDRSFLGGARRLEVSGRLAHVALCPQNVRADTAFSNLLNYYASATLRLPSLFSPRNIPEITLFSERTSEYRTYVRYTSIGGLAQITRDLSPRDLRPGLPLTLGYQIEYGRTKADPAVFCQIFNRCSLADIDRLQRNSSLQVMSATLTRDRTNNLLDPSRGSRMQLILRTGTTSVDTGAATRFSRVGTEMSLYQPFGDHYVIAGRVQLATVLEGFSTRGATDFVPPEERLYAGGPNTVRGFSQNLLGPVVYIVDSANVRDSLVDGRHMYVASDTSRVLQFSPTGGNSLVVGNLEVRAPAPVFSNVLQLAAFVDAGLVWNRPQTSVRLSDVRVTPGIGIRVNSPVGPFRVDVAYNGYPASLGAVYFVDPQNDRLRCVSPDNPFDRGEVVSGLECPTTFRPAERTSFFSRLTFNFSIGQAF